MPWVRAAVTLEENVLMRKDRFGAVVEKDVCMKMVAQMMAAV